MLVTAGCAVKAPQRDQKVGFFYISVGHEYLRLILRGGGGGGEMLSSQRSLKLWNQFHFFDKL